MKKNLINFKSYSNFFKSCVGSIIFNRYFVVLFITLVDVNYFWISDLTIVFVTILGWLNIWIENTHKSSDIHFKNQYISKYICVKFCIKKTFLFLILFIYRGSKYLEFILNHKLMFHWNIESILFSLIKKKRARVKSTLTWSTWFRWAMD